MVLLSPLIAAAAPSPASCRACTLHHVYHLLGRRVASVLEGQRLQLVCELKKLLVNKAQALGGGISAACCEKRLCGFGGERILFS